MYLLYIDLSGTPELQDHSTTYVGLGLCLHESLWTRATELVRELKLEKQLDDQDFELHATELCTQIREQHEIEQFEDLSYEDRRDRVQAIQRDKLARRPSSSRRRRYAAQSSLLHLSRIERSRLFEAALDAVGESEIVLFAEAVDKSHFFSKNPDASIVDHTWMQLVTRFDHFLRRRNRRQVPPDKGLLIVDQEPTREKLIREHVYRLRLEGSPWGQIKHVIELPFFVDSAQSEAIQLADLCAYATRGYIEKQGAFETVNFERIYRRFDRTRARMHGIRHYCAPKTCSCLICRERGHAALSQPSASLNRTSE